MSNDEVSPSSGTGPRSGQARKSPRQGVGGSPIGSTLSIVLAVVAVVAGFLILRNITNDNGGSSASDVGTPVDVSTTVDLSLVPTTLAPVETTVPPLVTQGATVLVANASGIPGSAGRMSTSLGAVGFTMAPAGNSTESLQVSTVYYDPSVAAAQAVAESVARSMGNLAFAVVPTPVPVKGGGLNGAGVLVLLGTAQADKTLEELSAAATPPVAVTAPPVAGATTTTPA
jgi:hypothetical protein